MFNPKHLKKHPNNLIKPIHNLQNAKKTIASKPKSTRNPKYSLTQIVLDTFKVKKKKTLELNSPHHIESFKTKVYRFGGMNRSNKNFFFLAWNLTISSFSSHSKRTK
jgi:hypothetical protein